MNARKQLAAQVFADLEQAVNHPSAEEIAGAIEKTVSPFLLTEIEGHLGWCDRCRQIQEDYLAFSLPAPPQAPADRTAEDAAWRSVSTRMQFRRPRVVSTRHREWAATAAGFLLCAVIAGSWYSYLGSGNRSAGPAAGASASPSSQPSAFANAAVIDLFPTNTRVRSPEPRPKVFRQNATPDMVTLILNGVAIQHDEAVVRLLLTNGKELWTGRLKQHSGVFTLALGSEIVNQRPLVIELVSTGNSVARYEFP